MAYKTPDPLIQRVNNKGYDTLLAKLKSMTPENFKKFQYGYHKDYLKDEADEWDEESYPYLSPEDYIESYDAQEGSEYDPESILHFIRQKGY